MFQISYSVIIYQTIGFLLLTTIIIPIIGFIICGNKFQFKKVSKFLFILLLLIIISWPCIIVNNAIYSYKIRKRVEKYIEDKDIYVYTTTVYAYTETSRLILENEIKNKYSWIKIDNYFNYLVIKKKDSSPEKIEKFQCFKIENKKLALKIIYNNDLQEEVLNE